MMKKPFQTRIKKALTLLKSAQRKEALVISSNPGAIRSRDTHYPYRGNSDLFYLTGSTAEDLTLVLRPYAQDPVVLLIPPKDSVKDLWEGAPQPIKPLARELRATLITTSDPIKQTMSLLKGADAVYLQSIEGTVSAAVKSDLSTRSTFMLRGLPSVLIDIEQLTGRLRLLKDPHEVSIIKRAAAITSGALRNVLPFVQSGIEEREIAAILEYTYRVHGAEAAFGTIVAAGASAATLHYRALNRKLKNGELLLIDTGAELNMYASDITRMIPVGDRVPSQVRDLYDAVLRAQGAAIKRVRPGIAVSEVYNAAARELTQGLKDLGVLKGKVSQLVQKGAFKPFFPHGIGHSLGIDVHDATPKGYEAVLEKGMVFTIEPGLYFQHPIRSIPACGIRIEDDVLVTSRGCEVLTDGALTKDLEELQAMLAG